MTRLEFRERRMICGSVEWRRLLDVIFGAALCFPAVFASASAQNAPSVERGRLIAVGGGPSGPGTACFSCHGLRGEGDDGAAFPRLAGLDAQYLAKQMADYAAPTRFSETMTPIAQQLSPADRKSVALYYAALPAQRPALRAPVDPGLLQRGAILYVQGSAERSIQACANCHGPAASGLNRTYPSVAAQPAVYTEEQLRLWREGLRKNDIADVMRSVTRRMTDDDIYAVSAYIAALPP